MITPDEIDERTVLLPAAHVAAVEVSDRLVLVDQEAGRSYALNPTGSLVWKLLDGSSPLDDLIADISDVFGAPPDEVASHVKGMLRNLAWVGLFDNVARSAESIPIDIEMVGSADSMADQPAPSFDDRYLAAPPDR